MNIKTNRVYLQTDVWYILQKIESAILVSEEQGNLAEVKNVVSSVLRDIPLYYSYDVTEGYDEYVHSQEFVKDIEKLKQKLHNLEQVKKTSL